MASEFAVAGGLPYKFFRASGRGVAGTESHANHPAHLQFRHLTASRFAIARDRSS
jgi:hypothetical protein